MLEVTQPEEAVMLQEGTMEEGTLEEGTLEEEGMLREEVTLQEVTQQDIQVESTWLVPTGPWLAGAAHLQRSGRHSAPHVAKATLAPARPLALLVHRLLRLTPNLWPTPNSFLPTHKRIPSSLKIVPRLVDYLHYITTLTPYVLPFFLYIFGNWSQCMASPKKTT